MIYIVELKDDTYCFWSTSKDAVLDCLYSYDKIKEKIESTEDKMDKMRWLALLERAKVQGVASTVEFIPENKEDQVLDLIYENRCGEDLDLEKECLSLDEILAYYPKKL